MLRRLLPLAAAVALTSLPAFARPFKVTGDYHTLNLVSFHSQATLTTITGKTDQVTGTADVDPMNLGATTGTIKVDLHAVDTGIAKRNGHMQGVLETATFPFAEFKATKVVSPVQKATPYKPVKVTIEGFFTLHGVTKPLKTTATVTWLPEQDKEFRAGDWLQMETSFPLKLSDFNMKAPRLIPMKVADELTISLTVMAKAQDESKPAAVKPAAAKPAAVKPAAPKPAAPKPVSKK